MKFDLNGGNQMNHDVDKLNNLMNKAVADIGAAASGALVLIGYRLGLFEVLAKNGPLSSHNLAMISGTQERMVREWLSAMAASDYVVYNPSDGTFGMTPEQTALFGDTDSPLFLASVYPCVAALYKDEPLVAQAFRHGGGVGWQEHDEDLFHGTDSFFGRVYENFLISTWLPSVENVMERLEAGAVVADVGCGHGTTTLLMARSFPKSVFFGFDAHEPSISIAEKRLNGTGLANANFQICPVEAISPENYDLAFFCDSFHEMNNPVAIASHMKNILSPDGTLMLVEQRAPDRLEDNLHPVGRLCYSFSAMICVPGAISQGAEDALGAQAGPIRLTKILREGGFSRVRKTAETPMHMVIEAKK